MIEKISTMCVVGDMSVAVAAWSCALEVSPTFVDGERWAQFDVAGARIALAGTDRSAERAGVLAKVADLDMVHRRLSEIGLTPTAIEAGPHERRFTVPMPGDASLTLYAAL